MKITSINNCNFKAIYFENYNNKYDSIQAILQNEIEKFSNGNCNATKLGEGINFRIIG